MKPNRLQISARAYLDLLTNELVFSRGDYEHRCRLEPLNIQLLEALINDGNAIVTREHLIAEVWDGNTGVGNKALTRNIYKLRKIFEKNGLGDLIETIPKKGYRVKVSKPKKHLKPRIYRKWVLAAAVVVALVIMKLLIPGLLHGFSHRMMH